jgi:multiple sugar transport system ATP-binding protein
MTMGDRVAVMNEGVLEQVGDTRTVYERPANVFVAGFIGSPGMAFAHMGAVRRNGSLVLSRGGLALTVDEALVPADGVGSEVVVGVRPEHTHLWRDASLIGPIDGQADYVEMLGREAFIGVVASGDVQFTVLAHPHADVRLGETVRFGFEPDRVYLFDAETERTLGGPADPAQADRKGRSR